MSDDDLLADLHVALDRTMAAFKVMTDKVMAGRVTWENIQDELNDDERAIFWAWVRLFR